MGENRRKHLTAEEKIIRRKAKRIERARTQLNYLYQDVERMEISDQHKRVLKEQISCIKPYLENNDREENQYNYDNFNG